MTRGEYPLGARVFVDGRDVVRITQVFPEGSSSYAFAHAKVDYAGGDKNVAVALSRLGVVRKPLGPLR